MLVLRHGRSLLPGRRPPAVAYSTSQRESLMKAKRILVKLGSMVVTRSNGNGIALSQMANIVEQVSHLQGAGREMGIVSSGAVAAGRQLMRNQLAVLRLQEEAPEAPLPIPSRPLPIMEDPWRNLRYTFAAPECAAVGQSSLVALYNAMFKVYGMGCGQILVTVPDLLRTGPREASCATIEKMLRMRLVPVINENDAVQYEPTAGDGSIPIPVGDNDAIAAVLAVELKCDLLLLLSNVNGVYTGDPSAPGSRFLPLVTPAMLRSGEIAFGHKSSSGRGGMESKVVSALYAAERGVSVIIGNGLEWRSVLDMIEGKPVGTLFSPH